MPRNQPKLNCCVRTLAQGVKAAHIIDGRVPHSLLLEIFTNEGIGTMLLASAPSALVLPAASENVPLATLTTPLVVLPASGVNVAV